MQRGLCGRELAVVEKHTSDSNMEDGVRVWQWEGAWSVCKNGRLWVHNDTPRKQAYQELYFHSAKSVVGTLTCSHPIKLWDLKRHLTPRDTARLQGFPETMTLPASSYCRLFGNAVSVKCAAFAISRVCEPHETIRHLDLCSGIGGFSFAVGLQLPNASTVGFSEIMKAAKECYSQNFPGVPDLGDAHTATWPECDLITAGFPCQPFSCSNSRARRKDHKSKDFYEVVVAAVSASRATRVVLENVSSFRTVGREKFQHLMKALEALGFYMSCEVLVGTDSGVPQRRRRLYMVGSRAAPPLPWVRPSATPTTLHDILDR